MTSPSIATIVGSGTMGPGIAAVLARAGYDVRVFDISPEAIERAEAQVAGAFTVLDALDIPAAGAVSDVTFGTDIGIALTGADLVVEAVPEMLDLKREVLKQIESHVSADALIGTNTSGIPISQLADGMNHPGRLIGMHWSNPPHVIPMIEVVPGDATDAQVVTAMAEIVRGFGYEAVIEREIAGFVENRVLYAILRECLALLQEGVVSNEDLDTCVKWGIGMKLSVVGPARLLDLAGIDIYRSVASYLNAQLDQSSGVPELIQKLADSGRLGMKTGGGMYEYADGEVPAVRGAIVSGMVAARKTLSALPKV